MHFSTSAAALVALASFGNAQSLQKINDFSAGPTKLAMYAYVPKNIVKPAPVIVAVHHCQGSATAFFGESKLQSGADKHGIILVYPNSKSSGGCFDVASAATLKHGGGGDSETIANMALYAQTKLGGDANRTFAMGASSGAMMMNVLAGTYPNIFSAVSIYNGVPDGCFSVASSTATSDPPGWSDACAKGQITKTASAWGDIARASYSGYTGRRPRMQIFHGAVDTTLAYANYAESLKQWSNVLGLTTSKATQNTPQSGYTQTIYGEGTTTTAKLVGYSAAGVGHTVPQHPDMDLAFFGLQ